MKYQYKKIIEITVEGDLPLLGYSVERVVYDKHNKEMDEAIRIAVKDGRPEQDMRIGYNEYKVTIDQKLRSI